MLIKEVCRQCNVTKKAIEYYEQQKLITPSLLENGYRDYSNLDIEKLKKIAILRKLDLSIQSIRSILSDEKTTMLCQAVYEKKLEMENDKLKLILLDKLSQGISWDDISEQLNQIEKKQTIAQKLFNAFPGYYGRFISIHFSGFLNESIITKEQQDAFEKIITFLDQIDDFMIPPDLQEFFEDATLSMSSDQIRDMSTHMVSAVKNIDIYMNENKEALEKYMEYKNSDDYKHSQAYLLQTLIQDFNTKSGYYDILIPAMKKLSPAYNEYSSQLENANHIFLNHYPDFK